MTRSNQADHLYKVLLHSADAYELHCAVRKLLDFYAPLSGTYAGTISARDVFLPSGKAVAPIGSAHCMLEAARTSKFVRGIYQAINQLKKDLPGQRIRILYAGSGPYGALLTPLTAFFSPEEIGFDILEINEFSLSAIRKLYTELGLLSYVNSFIQADASVYQIAESDTVHLVVSEAMNAALSSEPQVRIMMNLIPQLRNKGFFVPQAISVDAYLLDPVQELASFREEGKRPARIFLGNVYTIPQAHSLPAEPVTVQLPESIDTYSRLSLLTEIKVFDNERLSAYDCSLTLPLRVCNVDDELANKRVQFTYVMNENPHFESEFVN